LPDRLINLHKLVANWRVSVIGTLLQISLSVLIIWAMGYFLEWPIKRIITVGFVISVSSTAVIIRLLEDTGEIHQTVGQNVLGILLVQDILIVPMMIILGYLSGKPTSTYEISLQIIGGLLITGLIFYIFFHNKVRLPFHILLLKDHEIQVFAAFAICFGFAAITGFFGLSTALGSFVAGILVASSRSTQWFHDSLYPVKVIFVAMFFISVGMLINLDFLMENILSVILLVLVAFVANNVINTVIIHSLGVSWKESVYAGSLLSQIGEFSFVLGSVAYFNGIIGEYGYQLIVSVISLTLLLSPMWINFTKKLFRISHAVV
jgi:CPA2 family monovalent cation:H+ antiporter-2